MLEGEFYKTIKQELQNGITNIYKEITSANKEGVSGVSMGKKETEELFTKASEQLNVIIQTTEKATEDIMGAIEKQMELQAKDALQLKWKLVDLTEGRSY
jgi:chemotaxis protein CheZ